MALRVNLLGGLRVLSGAEGEVVVLPTRKARALLAYLACSPGRADLPRPQWQERRATGRRSAGWSSFADPDLQARPSGR